LESAVSSHGRAVAEPWQPMYLDSKNHVYCITKITPKITYMSSSISQKISGCKIFPGFG